MTDCLVPIRNTIVRAFEALADGGFVVSTVGRGTFVASETPQVDAPELPRRTPISWSSLVSRSLAAEPLGRLDRLAHR